MSRRKAVPVSIALLALLSMICGRGERVRRDGHAYAVEARLDAGAGRSVTVLTVDEFLEESAWYYEVNAGGREVVPMTFLYGCCHGGGGFTTLSTKDGDVVGLVRYERPDLLLMLHDFATGENWPREGPGGWRATSPIGERLRDRLRADHPGRRLELNE